ncbi:NADPH-dependent ferric siderophore reductase [Pseudochelatococcus lubricantis]|uniref:NADPH-dependent ferric siderophore reductase n=1 Tax=Pseudochelatococcus lubricantis TaxID=1538102 RepID=A0ABX0UUS1_9HYPH|nr:siderophore-interacting protein [Pseudochelatococcus lubricantis]NIJ56517.1 NADPH-dependent ferric siderophore reductase [Pseudochelatococcus lubricantis]
MNSTDQAPGRHQVERVRHSLRVRLATVRAARHLTPNMVRVTLAGDELAGFLSAAHDDHVKLFFPRDGEALPILPTITAEGRVLVDENARPTARDYTPRRFDAAAGELDIDFALHETGPASDWARAAAPGQRIGVAGPRGSFVVPDDFDWYLFIGDETAWPAIARRLEELRPAAPAIVLAEVADAGEEQAVPQRIGLDLHWLYRDGRAAGAVLETAAAALTLPAGEGYVWIAGESTVARRLREHFLRERGHPKAWLKASGYWKRGVANAHEEHDD